MATYDHNHFVIVGKSRKGGNYYDPNNEIVDDDPENMNKFKGIKILVFSRFQCLVKQYNKKLVFLFLMLFFFMFIKIYSNYIKAQFYHQLENYTRLCFFFNIN